MKNDEIMFGIALSGGGAKALTQIGALKVLEDEGIKPDYLSGTSMGSVNAVLYAAGYTLDEIYNIYYKNGLLKLFQLKLTTKGLVSNEKLGQLVLDSCKAKGYSKLEELPIPVYVAATDYLTRKPHTYKSGDIKEAIMASTASIMLNPCLCSDGVIRVDGCYTKNTPFDLLTELENDFNINNKHCYHIALDVVPEYINLFLPSLNKFNKFVYLNDSKRKKEFDYTCGSYIEIFGAKAISQTDFNRCSIKKAVKIGMESMLEKISEIKLNISNYLTNKKIRREN